jgi:hypothetical protein
MANQQCGIAKLESKQPTIRKRLHSKFSLDPSSSLHDLTKTWENIIILREIRKTNKLRRRSVTYPRKNIPKDLEKL